MEPLNKFVSPLLTDLYQLTMAHGYWKSGKQNDPATFDLFFRKNPFGGEFTIFAGLEEVLGFVSSFKFKSDDIDYLRQGPLAGCQPEFFDWLASLDCSRLKIYAPREGTIVFPRTPLLRVEGPLALAQLMETTCLNLVNFASLMATNALRFRLAAGERKTLIEFGLRRAQGPDGAVSASRYACMGGFDGTSNVLAGKLLGIQVRGTMAHSFVSSFTGMDEIRDESLIDAKGVKRNFKNLVLSFRDELGFRHTNSGELAAFTAYAQAFPNNFLALVDTYNTLASGVPNFICVALALIDFGYKPIGVRLDSGDLAYLSKEVREFFSGVSEKTLSRFRASDFTIFASNEIDEEILLSLRQQGDEIDAFGVGTHLATCKKQPALGCVYKLTEINGRPRIKLSDSREKITLPGPKNIYRLIDGKGQFLLDLMTEADEPAPRAGERILCRHPFEETSRVYAIPEEVILLNPLTWNGGLDPGYRPPSISEIRRFVLKQVQSMREDHLRTLNPTPYKVSVSGKLYSSIHYVLNEETPIGELR